MTPFAPPPPPPASPGASQRRAGPPQRPGSVYLLTVAGIPIYLHVTFLLVLVAIALPSGLFGLSGLRGVVFFILIFVSVALHELGHALMARRFGIRTEDIVLYPIGGVARLRSMGEGLQEFWISVAGPAVNVVIALALVGYLAVTDRLGGLAHIGQPGGSLAVDLLAINIMLFVFNLLPAFPMDGGRVLRSLLTVVASRERATAIATRIGQALALVFFVAGVLHYGLLLALIGVFVFFAAGQEYAVTRSQGLVAGRRVREAMITRFEVLQHGDTLGQAADLLLSTSQQDFPVLHGDRVIGVLSRKKLIEGLAAEGRGAYLAGFVAREFPRVEADDDLRRAFDLLLENPAMPVLAFEGDRLVGMITHENLMEFMMVERLLK